MLRSSSISRLLRILLLLFFQKPETIGEIWYRKLTREMQKCGRYSTYLPALSEVQTFWWFRCSSFQVCWCVDGAAKRRITRHEFPCFRLPPNSVDEYEQISLKVSCTVPIACFPCGVPAKPVLGCNQSGKCCEPPISIGKKVYRAISVSSAYRGQVLLSAAHAWNRFVGHPFNNPELLFSHYLQQVKHQWRFGTLYIKCDLWYGLTEHILVALYLCVHDSVTFCR